MRPKETGKANSSQNSLYSQKANDPLPPLRGATFRRKRVQNLAFDHQSCYTGPEGRKMPPSSQDHITKEDIIRCITANATIDKIPTVKASVEKEWRDSRNCQLGTSRMFGKLKTKKTPVHFTTLTDLCHLKHWSWQNLHRHLNAESVIEETT